MKTTIKTKPHTAAATIGRLFAAFRASFAAEVSIPAISTPPAECEHIEALLLHLCAGDERRALWVKRWLALPLRAPGIKIPTALIINGIQGVGVSLFFEQVAARLHGADARCIRDRQFESRFNDWTAGNPRMVVVDGKLTKNMLADMKNYVTSNTVMTNQKGIPPRVSNSTMNFVFTTSSVDFLRADTGSRRFLIIDTPPPRPDAFYRAVVDEIATGGVEAFRDHLLRLDLGDFNGNVPVREDALEAEAA